MTTEQIAGQGSEKPRPSRNLDFTNISPENERALWTGDWSHIPLPPELEDFKEKWAAFEARRKQPRTRPATKTVVLSSEAFNDMWGSFIKQETKPVKKTRQRDKADAKSK